MKTTPLKRVWGKCADLSNFGNGQSVQLKAKETTYTPCPLVDKTVFHKGMG